MTDSKVIITPTQEQVRFASVNMVHLVGLGDPTKALPDGKSVLVEAKKLIGDIANLDKVVKVGVGFSPSSSTEITSLAGLPTKPNKPKGSPDIA
jgi:hypothetical protein